MREDKKDMMNVEMIFSLFIFDFLEYMDENLA